MTFLFYLNGGQVKGVSQGDPWTRRIDAEFLGVVIDPPTPDGSRLEPPKIWDNLVVRNATPSEIAGFVSQRAQDRLLLERRRAKGFFTEDVFMRKVLKAIISVIVTELGKLGSTTSEAAFSSAVRNLIDLGKVD